VSDILSRREVERILSESYDDSEDVRALLRHDTALRNEIDQWRRKLVVCESKVQEAGA